VITRANHRILQRDANAIAALLAEVLSANYTRAAASATMRINRVIRS